jgi:medium-chain acyl-[acyl-carrier-protein] hydrolase
MIDFIVDEVLKKPRGDEPVTIEDSTAVTQDERAIDEIADTDSAPEKLKPTGLTPSASPWLWHHGKPDAPMRLFCFPYSGAGASAYRSWGPHLNDDIELWTIQYPGHESRVTETLIENMDAMCAALQEEIGPYLDRPYAFFGHSMGALLAFAFSQKRMHDNLPQPRALYISGCPAPQMWNPEESIIDLSDEELKNQIMKLGLMSPYMLAKPDLIDLYLTIIRSDFTLYESYSNEGITPLDCPIVALSGRSDPLVDRDQLQGWNMHTHNDFRMLRFSGGHFYLHDMTPELVQEICDDLSASESTAETWPS